MLYRVPYSFGLSYPTTESVSALILKRFHFSDPLVIPVQGVGFWLNPSLSNVTIIAADTNFAFSGLPETTLETGTNVTAGNFVGIQRPTADIGGFKILGLGGAASEGFTIDDFTYNAGTATTVPETPSLLFTGVGLVALGLVVRRKLRNSPEAK